MKIEEMNSEQLQRRKFENLQLNRCSDVYGRFSYYIMTSFPEIINEMESEYTFEFIRSAVLRYAERTFNIAPDKIAVTEELAKDELYSPYKASPCDFMKNYLYFQKHVDMDAYDAYEYYKLCRDIYDECDFSYGMEPEKEDEMYTRFNERLDGVPILKTGLYCHLEYVHDMINNICKNEGFQRRSDTPKLFDAYKLARPLFLKYRSKDGIEADDKVYEFDDRLRDLLTPMTESFFRE